MLQNNGKDNRIDPLPENFNSLDDFWSFWDTHSTTDYEESMDDVDIQIDVHSKIYCAVSKNLISQINGQAKNQGISTETLINLWLQEKINEKQHR